MKDKFGVGQAFLPVPRPHIAPTLPLGRRLFFRHLASAVGGYFLLPGRPAETIARAAMAPIGAAKYCIFVLMTGAPSHIDTFDLKEGSWTPKNFNPTDYNGVRFPQGLMPKIAEQLPSIALVRSLRSWAAVHALAQTWVQLGRNPTVPSARVAPHIGSVVSLELTSHGSDQILPAFVSLNAGATPLSGYLPAEHSPFYVYPAGAGLANAQYPTGKTDFDRRHAMLLRMDSAERQNADLGSSFEKMAAFHESARRLMDNAGVQQVFTFTPEERARYGGSEFGDACLAARNLVRSKLGARFIQISIGDWDHHKNIYGSLDAGNPGSIGRSFDSGLGTLLADLKADGLLDETLVVALGEFGRTVGPLNSVGGRDHDLQMSALLAGAKIRGGRALGATDNMGASVVEPGWSRNREVRLEDLEATIYSALGIDWTTVRRDDPSGRPFEYVPMSGQDVYGPVDELWL